MAGFLLAAGRGSRRFCTTLPPYPPPATRSAPTARAQRTSLAHDVLLCVGTGSNLDTPNRLRFETDEFYLKSAAEMAALLPDTLDAVPRPR